MTPGKSCREANDNVIFVGPDDSIQDNILTHPRLLVIDDEQIVGEVIAELLKAKGYEVEWVEGPNQALTRMEQDEFDTIITDLRMPGMNGKELFGRLEEWNPNLAKRVIFLTGDSLNDETQSFLADAGNSCLSKPFTLEQLERNIQTQLVLQG